MFSLFYDSKLNCKNNGRMDFEKIPQIEIKTQNLVPSAY